MPVTSRLRQSGFLFAAVFGVGYVINTVVFLSRGGALGEMPTRPYQLVILGFALLFLLSSIGGRFRWLQPTIFLAGCPLAIITNPDTINGLGFFLVAVFLLERGGFYARHRIAKTLALVAYLLALELAGAFVSKKPLLLALGPTLFILAFGVFSWLLYRDRLVVVLKEPRPQISLTERGLSPAERSYVRAFLRGKSAKEVAADFGVSESTVRTTSIRAYKKLGIGDTTELIVLSATHDILE